MVAGMRDVDAIVIGSGQGGVPLAATLAGEGKRVVLFERGQLGGTCVNSGCTPSKAFLAAAHSAGRARRASALGLHGAVTLDFPAVMDRVRGIIESWNAGVRDRLARAGVEVIAAEASFVDARVVSGDDVTVRAPFVLIDTGALAVIPPIPGLRDGPYLDNVSFFQQRTLPARLAVIGAGYIGLELGQGMARAGSAVTVIHNLDRVLNGEETDASDALYASLREDGIEVRFNARIERVERRGATATLVLADGARIDADAILVATGRAPQTPALHLERAGIGVDARGFVVVDEYLETACPGVYALGDAAGQPAFTHVSWEDHRRILATLGGTKRRRDDRVLAYTTFTEPQVARCGMTIEQAHAAGLRATAVTLPLSSVARAIEWNEENGFYRLVVSDDDDRVLGATFVGYEAGELIHVIVTLIDAGATWQQLAAAMHVHPTYAEGLPTLARLVPEQRAAAAKSATPGD
jgi:dihydrolipoamide dehydrogenase